MDIPENQKKALSVLLPIILFFPLMLSFSYFLGSVIPDTQTEYSKYCGDNAQNFTVLALSILSPILFWALLLIIWKGHPFDPKVAVGVTAGITLIIFIGSITGGSPSMPTAKDLMSDGIRDQFARGYGISQPRPICLGKGTTIYTQELVINFPIRATDVEFVCADSAICGEEKTLDVSGTKLVANGNIRTHAVVCSNEQRLQPPRICISIGNDVAAITESCSLACDIQD